jgi:Gpi18-like mannosyltransferase
VEGTARELGIRSAATSRSHAVRAEAWRAAATILVATRVPLMLVAYGAAWFLATERGPLQEGFVHIWARWDALHFFSIAEHGYTGAGAEPHATAFFPGFPLALRLGMALGLSPVTAGLAVSALASWIAFAFLFELAELDVGSGAGRRAVLYLALFPTGVFLIAPYSEALFLAGAIPAFFYARRGRWALAGVPAAVAVATRAAGLFVLAGLVLEFFRQRDFSRPRLRGALAGLAAGTLPVIAYGAYLAAATGDALRFLTDQRLGWHREVPTSPVTSLLQTWNTWSNPEYPSNWILAWRLEIVAALLGLAVVVWAVVKREWGYAAYGGTLMATLLLSTWYFSIPRMLLSLFPAVVFLAGATQRSERGHELALAVLAPLATLGVVVFTRGAWFY